MLQNSIPELSVKELRTFGFVTGAILVFLFSLLLPWFYDKGLQSWPLYIALPLWLFALVAPSWLKGVYYVWMKIGGVLGWLNTRIILTIVFYCLILPTGLLLMLLGKDPMMRKLNTNATSYRVMKKKRHRTHMERPF
ncbi:MAG: hypothetical protein ACI9VT_001166 [Psychroserpens sp.]|jgi:hypothetical protein